LRARFDHVGIVVKDIDAATSFLKGMLGFTLEREIDITGRLTAAILRSGEARVELIEVVADAPQAARPRDHFAFEVDDLSDALVVLRQAGVVTTREEPSLVGGARSFFTEAASTGGMTLQIFDRSR
jgi:lactoylglutathione lyase